LTDNARDVVRVVDPRWLTCPVYQRGHVLPAHWQLTADRLIQGQIEILTPGPE